MNIVKNIQTFVTSLWNEDLKTLIKTNAHLSVFLRFAIYPPTSLLTLNLYFPTGLNVVHQSSD